MELYDQNQYRVALERFRTADRVQHSPVFALYAARCLDKLGRLAEARRAYEVLVAEQLPAEAAPAWRAAVSDAKVELALLESRVPSARLTIEGAAPATLRLDGAPLSAESARSELWLNPGAHTLEARDAHGRVAAARFELAEGERNKPVKLVFAADAPGAAATSTRAPSEAANAPGTPRTVAAAASNPATDDVGVTLLSSAGAGLVVGAVTGWMAASKLSEIRANCVGNHCARSDEAKGDEVETLALVSTIGFVVGGASAGAWGLHVILRSPARQDSAFARPTLVQLSGAF